jgi:hypothetical protein
LDIKAWRNNTGLVQPPVQLDNYLPRTVIVDDIKVTNVAYPSDVSSEVIDKGVIQEEMGGNATTSTAVITPT